MWGPILGLSLLIALNPVLLAFILLVISRPRPIQNLFVFWVGAMVTNLTLYLIPLALIHLTPGFASFAEGLASLAQSKPGVIQPGPLGFGVFLLTIVAVMVVRLRLPERASVGSGGEDTSVAVLESQVPTTNSRPQGRVKGAVAGAVSAIQRFFSRLTATWESGSLWVALVLGLLYLPSATVVLLIDTTIAASGAGMGEQVIAAVVFVIGFLAVLEIVLVSHLIAPTKTEVVLRPLHEWAKTHGRHILIVFLALVGVWQLARGLGVA